MEKLRKVEDQRSQMLSKEVWVELLFKEDGRGRGQIAGESEIGVWHLHKAYLNVHV